MIANGIAAVVVAYFLAGVPIGLFVGRAMGVQDIRKHGSGNIGATNVLRVIGVKAGLFVWVMDCLKGVVPVLLARHLFGVEGWWVGAAAVGATFGHCFSPYLKFTGGRGVSTGLGVLTGLFWPVGLCAFLLFVLVVAKTRYVSLGSMLGASSAPIWALVWSPFLHGHTLAYAIMSAGCAAIIVYRHADNITRLRAGTERKLGQKAKPVSETEAEGDDADR